MEAGKDTAPTRSEEPQASGRRSHHSCRIFFAKILSSGFTLAQFAAGFTSIVLAALRLSRQDYVEPADQRQQRPQEHQGVPQPVLRACAHAGPVLLPRRHHARRRCPAGAEAQHDIPARLFRVADNQALHARHLHEMLRWERA